MNTNETRILNLPSLTSAFVSMPQTAWYWLDDLVQEQFPVGGYRALVREFKQAECPETLSRDLRRKAQQRCDEKMAELYHLANDNTPSGGYGDLKENNALPGHGDISVRMPMVFRLFHFMPQPTYLTTVWERRNYHLR